MLFWIDKYYPSIISLSQRTPTCKDDISTFDNLAALREYLSLAETLLILPGYLEELSEVIHVFGDL